MIACAGLTTLWHQDARVVLQDDDRGAADAGVSAAASTARCGQLGGREAHEEIADGLGEVGLQSQAICQHTPIIQHRPRQIA